MKFKLITFITIFLLTSFMVSAANIYISPSNIDANPGDTITLDIMLDRNVPLSGGNFNIEATDDLTVDSWQATATSGSLAFFNTLDSNTFKGLFAYVPPQNLPAGDNSIFQIDFTVPNDADQDIILTLEEIYLSDTNNPPQEVTSTSSGVTINLPEQNPPQNPPQNPVCGNNIKEDGEQCDGNDFDSQSCQDFGFDTGTLTCTASCTLTYENCAHNRQDYQGEDPIVIYQDGQAPRGSQDQVGISLRAEEDVGGIDFKLNFDPTAVFMSNLALASGGSGATWTYELDNAFGEASIALVRTNPPFPTGSLQTADYGILSSLFNVWLSASQGNYPLNPYSQSTSDPLGQLLPTFIQDGTFTVTSNTNTMLGVAPYVGVPGETDAEVCMYVNPGLISVGGLDVDLGWSNNNITISSVNDISTDGVCNASLLVVDANSTNGSIGFALTVNPAITTTGKCVCFLLDVAGGSGDSDTQIEFTQSQVSDSLGGLQTHTTQNGTFFIRQYQSIFRVGEEKVRPGNVVQVPVYLNSPSKTVGSVQGRIYFPWPITFQSASSSAFSLSSSFVDPTPTVDGYIDFSLSNSTFFGYDEIMELTFLAGNSSAPLGFYSVYPNSSIFIRDLSSSLIQDREDAGYIEITNDITPPARPTTRRTTTGGGGGSGSGSGRSTHEYQPAPTGYRTDVDWVVDGYGECVCDGRICTKELIWRYIGSEENPVKPPYLQKNTPCTLPPEPKEEPVTEYTYDTYEPPKHPPVVEEPASWLSYLRWIIATIVLLLLVIFVIVGRHEYLKHKSPRIPMPDSDYSDYEPSNYQPPLNEEERARLETELSETFAPPIPVENKEIKSETKEVQPRIKKHKDVKDIRGALKNIEKRLKKIDKTLKPKSK